MSPKHHAAVLGFAFVAAWIGFGFGDAILCLLGAAAFWAGAAMLEGEIDLGALQSRAQGVTRAPNPPTYPPAPAPRPAATRRVR